MRVHIKGRTYSFPVEYYQKLHTTSGSSHSVSWSHLSQGKQCTQLSMWCNKIMIHQTRPTSYTDWKCSYDAHVPHVCTFDSAKRSIWAPWPSYNYATLYTTNLALCVLTPFYQYQHWFFSTLSYSTSSTWINYISEPLVSTCIDELFSPMTLSPVFLSWTTFGSFWPLQTRNISWEL